MNQLKTTDIGGFPLVLNDFRWIDSGYREAFTGIMSSYGIESSNAIVLSGCERTVDSGTVSIATGFVSIGGEICFVPDHSYSEPGSGVFEYWNLYISDDNEGYKTFQSTLNYDTYKRRIAKITTASSVPSGYTKYQDAENVFQVMKRRIPRNPWVQFATQIIPEGGIIPGTYILECRLDFDGFVHLRGKSWFEDLNDVVHPDNQLIGTLPTGFRPSKLTVRHVKVKGATSFGEGVFEIAPNGEIRVKLTKSLPEFGGFWEVDQIVSFEAVT